MDATAKTPGRRIVVCLDGTNNEPGEGSTNVQRLYRMVARIPGEQLTYYQPGVGTLEPVGVVTAIWRRVLMVADSAGGWMMKRHVCSAYEFSDSNHEVRTVRHALSLDEHRVNFEPRFWRAATDAQDVRQLCFPGVHADVGGGYTGRAVETAKVSLAWMVGELTDTSIVFDPAAMARAKLPNLANRRTLGKAAAGRATTNCSAGDGSCSNTCHSRAGSGKAAAGGSA